MYFEIVSILASLVLTVGLVVGMTGGPVYLSKTIGLLVERKND